MKIRTINNLIAPSLKIISKGLWLSRKTSCVWRCMFVVMMTCFFLLPGQWSRAQTIYVEACAKGPGSGTESDPFNKLGNAADAAAPGSIINLQCGNYMEQPRIYKPLTLTASGGTARIGMQPDHLWAGVNNGDIFDVPDETSEINPDMTLGAMLDELAASNLRVIRLLIDYRLDLDEYGHAYPIGEYNDCILEAIDNLMVEMRQRGLLLLIAFESHNWMNEYLIYEDWTFDHVDNDDWYSWRRCKTPLFLYRYVSENLNLVPEKFTLEENDLCRRHPSDAHMRTFCKSPHRQRVEAGVFGEDYILEENYFSDDECKDVFKMRVEHILNHRNPLFDNKKWKDINDVIWAWAVHSEPEYMGDHENLVPWLHEMSSYIKGIDPDTYLALGTMGGFLEHNFVDVDIYTIHAYEIRRSKLEDMIRQFRSPQGIGGKYGKLLLIEEIPGGDCDYFFELFDEMHVPWMIWEYEWDDRRWSIWPDRDVAVWNCIATHADVLWNTPNCLCNSARKPWRVSSMVEALIDP